MNSLRERTLTGLGWSGAARLLNQMLQVAATIVLARLLSPREYGLLGMVLVFTGFASSMADMGLGASIIQRSTLSERHLNSVFWLNLATGIVLTLLIAGLAPFLARFYGEPQLRSIAAVIALNFSLASLNVVQNALLDKSLDFRAKFRIETTSTGVAGIVALLLAFGGAGVWSLVGQLLTVSVLRVLIMWARSQWRPKFAFDLSAIKELMRFSGHLTGFGAVIYWSSNVDKLVIGRWIGSAALGVYGLADRLMRLPLTNVTDITTSVMFPALSSIQHEQEAVRRAYLRGIGMIALITCPAMIAMGVLAEPAILVVYGLQWQASIPILQLLCCVGMAQSIYNTAAWIFLSQGRTDILFRLGVYTTAVRAVGVLVGAHWGLIGVAWAYVLGTYILVWYPTWSSAARLIGVDVPTLLRRVAGPFGCAALMGAALWLSDRGPLEGQSMLVRLGLQLPLAALFYLVLIRQSRLRAWSEMRGILLEMGGRRSRLLRWILGDDGAAIS